LFYNVVATAVFTVVFGMNLLAPLKCLALLTRRTYERNIW